MTPISLDISGITYECDGSSILARLGDATYGPTPLSEARRLGDGSVYLTLGVLHAVLTGQAFDILRGEAPMPEPVTTEASEEQAAPAPTKRSKKK